MQIHSYYKRLRRGIIWVAALLATLLSLDKLFRYDALEGFIDQLLLSRHSLMLLLLTKIVAHWLMTGLPLVLLSPLLGLFLNLSDKAIVILFVSLLLGTPILSLVGAIFATLTLSLRNHILLLPLLVLPFYIPVLIFGAGSVVIASAGLACSGQLAILGALLILALSFAPWATAAALEITA